MRHEVKLLDAVALLEDVQAEGVVLQRGEVGAVVEVLAPGCMRWNFVMTKAVPMRSPACLPSNYWCCTIRARRVSRHSVIAFPRAASRAHRTDRIPIVFWAVADPVEAGLVASLAQPGGNLTGLTILAPEQSGKRLELLTEAVPRVSRVAVLWNPADRYAALEIHVMEAAARDLGVQLQSLEVRAPSEFQRVRAGLRSRHAGRRRCTQHPGHTLTPCPEEGTG